jgi:hypothetical protein
VNNALENVTGYGIPRYNYIDNVEDGSVQAQVMLPDMRAFTGDFAATRQQVGRIIRHVSCCSTDRSPSLEILFMVVHPHSQSVSVLSRI